MNEEIMKKAGFAQQVKDVKNKTCPMCKQKIGEFRDRLSQREYEISGLCQKCQDKIFG